MNNYGLVDKSGNKQEMDNQLDDNIVFEDEELNYEPKTLVDGNDDEVQQEVNDENNQWTQEMDDVLIENYHEFSSLDKKKCFTFLAELVSQVKDRTAKECHMRARDLKLKKGNLT